MELCIPVSMTHEPDDFCGGIAIHWLHPITVRERKSASRARSLPKCTGQIELVGIRIILQIVHDVSLTVPGEYQAKVGDCRRYPEERNDVIVFELLHQHHFFAKPLQHLLERQAAPRISHDTLTLLALCMDGSSWDTLRTLTATILSSYLPVQISVALETRCARSPSFLTPSSS